MKRKKKDRQGKKLKVELKKVPIDSIKLGPIRHESLPEPLLKKIEAIYRAVGHYTCATLEEFERDFMRDMTPEREVAIWANIALAWLRYRQLYDPEQKLSFLECKHLSGSIIALSMGVSDEELINQIVTKTELERLKYCCRNPMEGDGLVDGQHRL